MDLVYLFILGLLLAALIGLVRLCAIIRQPT